jgi:hypothetical protein
MKRPLALLFVLLFAVTVWLAVRWLDSGPGVAPPEVPAGVTAPHADESRPAAPETVLAPDAAGATAAERVAAPVETDGGSATRAIPEDSIWIDVRVIDGGTRRPVAGAEVRWATSVSYQQVALLPAAERKEYSGDREATARRFGWSARTDGDGKARVAATSHGAHVFATSEGRYAEIHVGGSQVAPAGGWVLLLEADHTLRARVLDAQGRPAVGAQVGIRMFGKDDQPVPNRGGIRPLLAKGPEAMVEFRHLQTWLKQGSSKRELEVARWRIALEVPGVDHAGPGTSGVDFDVDQPPREPVELRLPPTGRIAARLLHEGQVLIDGVTFHVQRGNDRAGASARHEVDADGWARIPYVGLGGELVVVARTGHGETSKVVAAPLGEGQEVRVELSTAELLALTGRFLGPDRQPLANATVESNFDLVVASGGGLVTTDAQGRFLWLLTNRHRATPQIKRLVFSQRPIDGPPRSTTVTPREIQPGTTDLGVLVLEPEALVVSGRMRFDVPPTEQRIWFQVESLDERRGGKAEERWSQAASLTVSQQRDGRFEVRGHATPARHRLTFPSTLHLPIAPVEFRIGQEDVEIPVVVGNVVQATCLIPDELPKDFLRGVFVPGFDPPMEHHPGEIDRFGRGNRYEAEGWGTMAGRCQLRWNGLPPGTYTVHLTAVGLGTPLASIDDVVLPLPEGGDPRLLEIDLRGKLQMLLVRLGNVPERVDGRGQPPVLVFSMPQADDQLWQGLQFHDGKLQLPVVPGPLELMVLGGDSRPQRWQFSAEQVASGQVSVDLRPWPTVELLVPDVPDLPTGITLSVYCSLPYVNAPVTRRFAAMGVSGDLDRLFMCVSNGGQMKEGRVTVSLGDATYRVGAYLRNARDGRTISLQSVAPSEIVGGDNLAPITVQLSPDEIRAALEKLAAAGK